MPERIVIDCCAPNATDEAVRAVEAVVEGNPPAAGPRRIV